MTPENFAYWLQGFSEICGQTPSKEQWEIIKDHLNLVFNKVTPNREMKYCSLPTSPPALRGTGLLGGVIDEEVFFGSETPFYSSSEYLELDSHYFKPSGLNLQFNIKPAS